ncbi:MAG: Gfo/Idh/MocA family oxidoreductase [Nitrospirae bacterium]|nr:Gfo/Idh/MocA family oxidoreductase [Nitrospirota bacterium]
MTTPMGIGLIGLGRHGMRYAKHLLEPMPGARLVAVCRRDAAQGRAFAAAHGLGFYQDYRDLIAAPTVQAVIVVTPPSLTKPICLEAVRAGKPLLIEKPLATNGPEAHAMVCAAKSAGVPLMTAQTLRFDPAVVALKAELALVEPWRYFVLTSRVEPRPEVRQDPADYAGRGVLLEIGVHQLDLVRFFTGEEVAEVCCELWHGEPGQPESRALVRLRTASGLPGLIDVSRVSAGRVGRAEWVGEKGQLMADWYRHRLCKVLSRNVSDEWTVEDRPTLVETLTAFLRAIELGTPMPITGFDGQKAVEIADACYQSAATGKPVTLGVMRDQ